MLLTLNENKDFRRIYARGKSMAHPILVTYAMRNRLGITRYGITTSKKIGKAVKRNRARRIIKAAVQLQPRLPCGYDLIFVARARTTKVKSTDIFYVMRKQIKMLTQEENYPSGGKL